MAYNGSGTFNRVRNWATDKTNNVPVTASRMDEEMDGMATGLSTAICKDGQQTATARIPFAAGTSAMAGAVSGASYAQTNDANTGVYFPATDEVALTAGGVQVLAATATVVTIPTGIALKSNTTPYDAFASGTRLLFHQTAAPTGWTKSSSHNDKAIRVVSGTVSSGGSVAFSTCFSRTATDNITLSTTHLPSHTHTGTTGNNSVGHTHTFTSGGISANHHHIGTTDSGGVDHTHSYNEPQGSVPGATVGASGLLNVASTTGGASAYLHTHTFTTGNVSDDHTHSGTTDGISANHTHSFTSAATGSGTAFTGGMDIQVQYMDVIVAEKA